MPGATKMPRRLGIDIGLNGDRGQLRGALATPWRVYQTEGTRIGSDPMPCPVFNAFNFPVASSYFWLQLQAHW